MSQEIEIEFKNLLSEDEYMRMLDGLPFEKETFTEQTNYYFETADMQLKEKGAALRIRRKGDSWTMTLKEPHPQGLLETHDILDEQEADRWIQDKGTPQPNVTKQLEMLGVDYRDLQFLGSLSTRRREIDYEDTVVTLDYSRYFRTEDYELEIEASSKQAGEAVFDSLLRRFSIPKRETKNKIRRFYEARVKSD